MKTLTVEILSRIETLETELRKNDALCGHPESCLSCGYCMVAARQARDTYRRGRLDAYKSILSYLEKD